MTDSLNEIAPIRATGSQNTTFLRFIYRGQSMAPTFSPGQIIYVNTQFHAIEQGDVIVFQHQKELGRVVHRVTKIKKDGFVTRGDNNLENDLNLVLQDQVIGRVEKADFRGQARPVNSGWHGILRAQFSRKQLLIKRFLRRALGRPYCWLKCSGIVAKLWQPNIETIHFETQNGPLVKYVYKGRTVASCWVDSNQWWFRRPYDFVINPRAKEKSKN